MRNRLVVNVRSGARYDVYVGRGHGSIWGNPFSHLDGTLAEFRVATRDEAIARYEDRLLQRLDLLARLPDLRGKVLGCWCAPLRCHAEVLVHYANLPVAA
ncbi:MAG: DUF4326 domain-containing protein [Kofleriaceae bacterium]